MLSSVKFALGWLLGIVSCTALAQASSTPVHSSIINAIVAPNTTVYYRNIAENYTVIITDITYAALSDLSQDDEPVEESVSRGVALIIVNRGANCSTITARFTSFTDVRLRI